MLVVLLALAAVLSLASMISSTLLEVSYDGSSRHVDEHVAIADEGPGEQERADEGLTRKAIGIVSTGQLFLDGEPITIEQSKNLVSLRGHYNDNVVYIDQNEVLPSGCEIVSLCAAMRAEGYDVSPTDMTDRFLRTGENVATDYLGSAYTDGGGLPPCIVDAANAWIDSNNEEARAYDLTGSSFESLVQLSDLGYPIVVWTTEKLEEPEFVGQVSDGMQWYVSEHCVALCSLQGEEVLVANSLEGLRGYDRRQFAHIYESCGRKAMLVVPGRFDDQQK